MKLLVVTDSLGLPREKPEKLEYNETWCYLLKNKHEIHQCSIGGAKASQLLGQINYLKLFNPDFVIIQSGIVDCTPRALTESMNGKLNSSRFRRKLTGFILPYFKKSLRKKGITYTTEKEFEEIILSFQSIFPNKLIWIGIAPSDKNYELKVPGITNNINIYNSIIKKVVGLSNFIDLSHFNQQQIMTDFHHLNKKGHEDLVKILLDRIEKKNDSGREI